MRNISVKSLITFIVIGLQAILYSQTNQLSILNSSVNGTKPGYIIQATLVLEPNGGYVEQSLYLTYSDKSDFSGQTNLEVVHRFSMPNNAVVNDMWLWMGNNVMQAVMMDTWSARKIYDSIVTNKRDPAFLSKQGNQYEVHVYPLTSGSYRKIKINFIVPARWKENQAFVELPYKMLMANKLTTKPLEILVRKRKNTNSFSSPYLLEQPSLVFKDFKDTLEYTYQRAAIDDITKVGSLTFQYLPNIEDGCSFGGFKDKTDSSYFQLSVNPGQLYNIGKDSTAKKLLFSIDLSGFYNKNLTTLIPKLSAAMKSSLKTGDKFNVLVTGAKKVKYLNPDWLSYSQQNVDAVMQKFLTSTFADSIKTNRFPNLIFCDSDASTGWSFDGINNYAITTKYQNIVTASTNFNGAEIVAAYRHGFDDLLSQSGFNTIITPLDSLFMNGGRFLTYFDRNRNAGELIAKHYINGIKAVSYSVNAVTLYRNFSGNVGKYMPEKIDHNFVYTFEYDDPDVVVELKDEQGRPVVISKKVRNGLLVVSGIWAIKDDAALKTTFGIALLGLNALTKERSLPLLLAEIRNKYIKDKYDKVVLISNSDSLYTTQNTGQFAVDYKKGFGSSYPIIHTINLLDALNFSPPSITVDQVIFYGGGYLLYSLAQATGGLSYETSASSWESINAGLSPYTIPKIESVDLGVSVDGGTKALLNLREVNKERNNTNKPLFFLGLTNGKTKIKFNVNTKFSGIQEIKTKEVDFFFGQDSTRQEKVIPAMLANEKLKELFLQTKLDTLDIVKLAMKNNLLCDFTALLALEPNEKYHFMKNPLNEGGFSTGIQDESIKKDTGAVDIYPNPFNNSTRIRLKLPNNTNANVSVYNMLGQRIIELIHSEIVSGEKIVYWNGKNSNGSITASGIYFLVVELKSETGKPQKLISKKMLMLK